jgi:hypothetical protein
VGRCPQSPVAITGCHKWSSEDLLASVGIVQPVEIAGFGAEWWWCVLDCTAFPTGMEQGIAIGRWAPLQDRAVSGLVRRGAITRETQHGGLGVWSEGCGYGDRLTLAAGCGLTGWEPVVGGTARRVGPSSRAVQIRPARPGGNDGGRARTGRAGHGRGGVPAGRVPLQS